MMLTLILLVLALICFIWAAAGAPAVPGNVNLTALGLAFWVLTVLIARGGA
jgi:hypothetical protein